MARIVSVQDLSCFGQCSLTVALPILSAHGIETAVLPSGVMSTHTGFDGFTFLDLTEEMDKIIDHWIKEQIRFDGIYTGFIGGAGQFALIGKLKSVLKPEGRLYVDPAMADGGSLYPGLGDDIVEGMKGLVREADVILPNLTEAALLLGRRYQEEYTREDLLTIAESLADLGPETVILTGVSCEKDRIGALAYTRSGKKITEYYTQKKALSCPGTGDVFSSRVIAGLVHGIPLETVLRDSCEFVAEAIEKTMVDPEHVYGVKFEEVLAEGK